MSTTIIDRGDAADFRIHRDTDWIQDVQIATDGGDPQDILNWSPELRVWGTERLAENNPESPLYELNQSNGRIDILSASGGVVRLTLDPDETVALPFGAAHYRLTLVRDDGEDLIYLKGSLIVL